MENSQISKKYCVDDIVVRKIRMCVNLSLASKRCFLSTFEASDEDEMIEHLTKEKHYGRIQDYVYQTTNKHIAKDVIKLIVKDVLIS